MTKMEKPNVLSRRAVLMGAGALVVSVGAPMSLETLLGMNAAFAQGTKPPLTPEQLSSYIAINADGSVSAFFGREMPGCVYKTGAIPAPVAVKEPA